MQKILSCGTMACFALLFAACSQNPAREYESVPGDPMNTRIYTLDNGLKVYLTVNKETPRIQTYIAVRVGSKDDPAETTGLSHYLEHIMFKGTSHFGTSNYEAEKPLLDEIEKQFEEYRLLTDEAERKTKYQIIDSLSYEASKYAIPNEYDKLMSTIGAQGTNAYTANDMTVYVEDIPSNQLENWAKIQADRFQNMVIRGFHTELETVYEEKNMSLTNDNRKMYEALLASMFPNHPYGTQTTLGTQEHLKNPSITNIKKHFETWYVPNNMAICMSGDLNPDSAIAIVERNFGSMKPNPNLPEHVKASDYALKAPVSVDVKGLEAEQVALGWPFPGHDKQVHDLLTTTCYILYNGKAGLIDTELQQTQKLLSCYSGTYGLSDYQTFLMAGQPKQGQTLDEVKSLMLGVIDQLKKGDFDESLIPAAINNLKLAYMNAYEDNSSRANMFVQAFINGEDWKDEVEFLDRMAKITKQQIVDFANKYFTDNFVTVYKRQGVDETIKKIEKPAITPIVMNRDSVSDYVRQIQLSEVKPIEPVFIDFEKDMAKTQIKPGLEMLYKHNDLNDIFTLTYYFDKGTNDDKYLSLATQYFNYLGTSTKTLQEINKQFYDIACNFNFTATPERTYVQVSGLGENMEKAVALLEELLADAQVNKDAYNEIVSDNLKGRENAKADQDGNYTRLAYYALYGENSPFKNILPEAEMRALDPQVLVDQIHNLNSHEHEILYYGPSKEDEVLALINKLHRVPEKLQPIENSVQLKMLETPENKVLFAYYDAKQIKFYAYSNRGEKYNPGARPAVTLYNQYFGSGMNSIVFQEMREARALAYSSAAYMVQPGELDKPYYYCMMISTQNDKMISAIDAFNEIINNMPISEKAFTIAKEGLISRLRSERITGAGVLWSYIDERDLGSSVDSRKALFEKVQTMTLDDVLKFQQEWVKGRTFTYCVLGDDKDLDMKSLAKYGKITKLSQKDIFGY